MKRIKSIILVLFTLILTVTSVAYATPDTDERENTQKGTQFYVTPYAWFVGMNGTIGARGRTTEVDFSFSDVSDYVDFAGMLGLEVVFNNTNGIVADINLIELGKQKSFGGVSLGGETRILLSDIAAFHRLTSKNFGEKKASVMHLDVLAGARIWNIDVELNLDTPYMGSHTITRNRDWVDPFVGLRAQFLMNERLRFVLQGSLGGGGQTSSSWDASAQLAWKMGRHSSLMLGYRAVGVDRCEGEGTEQFVFDTTVQGPMVGLMFEL